MRRLVGGVGEEGAPQLVEGGEVAAGRRRALDQGDEELAAVAAHQLEQHARQQPVEHAPRRPLGDVVEATGVQALDVRCLDAAQLHRRQGGERGHGGRRVGAVVARLQARRQVGLVRRRQAVDQGAGDEERERVEDLQAVAHVPAVDPQPVQVPDDALALLGEAPLHDAADRRLAQAHADVVGSAARSARSGTANTGVVSVAGGLGTVPTSPRSAARAPSRSSATGSHTSPRDRHAVAIVACLGLRIEPARRRTWPATRAGPGGRARCWATCTSSCTSTSARSAPRPGRGRRCGPR